MATTIAEAIGTALEDVVYILRDQHGIAIGDTFPVQNPPDALVQLDGKMVLKSFTADPLKIADKIPKDKVPEDIIFIINELINL